MSEEDRGQHFWRTDSCVTHGRSLVCKKVLDAYLLCKSDLFHEVQVVPEKGFGKAGRLGGLGPKGQSGLDGRSNSGRNEWR